MGRLRVGIDLGGTKIEAAALDDAGEIRWRCRRPTPQGDYPATLATVAGLIAELEADLGPQGPVGIGTPGSLSPVDKRMRNSNSVCLNGRRLDQDLQEALGRPVRLANDADCFALSEAVDGAGQGAGSVFGVILGTGVGGGIVVNGRLLRGVNGIAGEWGHNPLPWPRDEERPGPRCYCGKRGCIETFLSGPGLAADHAGRHGRTLTPERLAQAATGGDPEAAASLGRYEDRLARSLATVIDLLDPEVIVLGGGLSHLERLYTEVPRLWSGYVFSDCVRTRLSPPVHGDSGGVRGAAWLWG